MKKVIATHTFYALRIFLILFILITATENKTSAQNINLETSLEKDSIKIGEQTRLKLAYSLPTDRTFQPLAFKDTITKAIEIIEQSGFDTIVSDDLSITTYEQEITITAFDTGFQVLPPLKFQSENDSAFSQPMLIYVAGMSLGKNPQLLDIKNPLEVSFSFIEWLHDYWPWLVGIVLVGILAFAIWWFLKKRKLKEPEEEVVQPQIPADVIAIEALKKLEKQGLWQKGELKRYHSEISEILRAFIESRFDVNALEQTTDEIMRNLKFTEADDRSKAILKEILQLSDYVKFAKAIPTEADNELSMKNALNFVVANKVEEEKEKLNNQNKES